MWVYFCVRKTINIIKVQLSFFPYAQIEKPATFVKKYEKCQLFFINYENGREFSSRNVLFFVRSRNFKGILIQHEATPELKTTSNTKGSIPKAVSEQLRNLSEVIIVAKTYNDNNNWNVVSLFNY